MAKLTILVLGAGPAGSTAAIAARIAGLDVNLIESQSFPRDRPGETLHSGIQTLMARLGLDRPLLDAGFVRHEGTWVQWDDVLRFEAFGGDESGPWRGFQAWRADFDAMLLERARELGVEVLQPCRAIEPVVEDGCVVGAKTSQGLLRADFVIDAAGGNHWLARRLGSSIEQHSPRLLARYGYRSTSHLPDDRLPAILAERFGWTWHAKIKPHVYNWTQVALDGEAEFDGSSGNAARGADVTWRVVDPPAGRGYFCTGDAACVLDPASSHGVLRAIMTGMMAVHVIQQIVADPHRENSLIGGYNRWLRDWFLHDVAELRQLYARLSDPPQWILNSDSDPIRLRSL